MTFTDLSAGASVFLDANVFVLDFTAHPKLGPACRQLLQRIENGELSGFTSTHILAEMAHRIMTIEAQTAFGWPATGIAQRLRRHPAQVQTLTGSQTAITHVLNSRLQVLMIPPQLLPSASNLSRQTGLLTNDSLAVALMQSHGLANLASDDSDFDGVPGIQRFAPA